MGFQTVFNRYELKYMLTQEQKERVLLAMDPYMKRDAFGRTTIRNLYFDTERYLLVRRSIEGPAYKEKLRIRSYAQADADSTVFVELKKKYQAVVYKRRIALPEHEAMAWAAREEGCRSHSQIAREIEYVLDYYETLRPVVFLSYEREAFCTREPSEFRVTFDEQILCRQEDLSLKSEVYGTPLLPEGAVLMEIKCAGGIPIWMIRTLSEEHIYKTSYSKYGTAYQRMIFPRRSDVPSYSFKEEPVYV